MLLEFVKLEESIKKFVRGRRVYYVPNPGNWGDGLLRYATHAFFRKIGLGVTEVPLQRKQWIFPMLKGGVVLYGAGGAWCHHYDRSPTVRRIARRFPVLVLPSTYAINRDFPGAVFFRRDCEGSLHHMPQSEFCHDMAFFLGKIETPKGVGTGWFFRTDAETNSRLRAPSQNADISSRGNEFTPIAPFLSAIAAFSIIHTDRLHVAIPAALMGREVHLYPGRYFKNGAVYRSSMHGRFSNVVFHEDGCVAGSSGEIEM